MVWNHGADQVTVTFDPDKITTQAIIEIIDKAGFKSAAVATANASPATPAAPVVPWSAPLPESAPDFFKKAFARARASRTPMVLDFSATWCAPCVRIKKETLQAPSVSAALSGVEVIHIDLDAHLQLARAYGVKSVPDVFLVDGQGMVVDRVRDFETAELFLPRIEKLVKKTR